MEVGGYSTLTSPREAKEVCPSWHYLTLHGRWGLCVPYSEYRYSPVTNFTLSACAHLWWPKVNFQESTLSLHYMGPGEGTQGHRAWQVSTFTSWAILPSLAHTLFMKMAHTVFWFTGVGLVPRGEQC